MKKTTNFKKMAIAAIFAIASVGAYAQYVGPTNPAAYDSTGTNDYATVGSRMPYYVTPDPIIHALEIANAMYWSQFDWTIPLGVTPKNYANTAGLTTLAAPAGAPGWVEENEISVIWPAATAPGMQTITVQEHSVPLSQIFAQGCAGNIITMKVYLIARPTIIFTLPIANNYVCGVTPGTALNDTFFIPVSVTGIGPWNVTYSATYNGAPYKTWTTMVGSAPGETDANVLADAAATTLLVTGGHSTATTGLPVDLNGGGATNGYGVYVVSVTNITDAVSRKSLDPALIAAQATDLPQAPNATYSIYISPTPVSTHITHLKN